MASITVRNLDDEVKARLRVRAAEHDRSMEKEVCILAFDSAAARACAEVCAPG